VLTAVYLSSLLTSAAVTYRHAAGHKPPLHQWLRYLFTVLSGTLVSSVERQICATATCGQSVDNTTILRQIPTYGCDAWTLAVDRLRNEDIRAELQVKSSLSRRHSWDGTGMWKECQPAEPP